MFHSQWLHNLSNLARSRRDRRRSASRQPRGVRLVLEALEERLTPTGPTVTQSAATTAALQTLLTDDTAANTNYVINLTGTSSTAYDVPTGQELTVPTSGAVAASPSSVPARASSVPARSPPAP